MLNWMREIEQDACTLCRGQMSIGRVVIVETPGRRNRVARLVLWLLGCLVTYLLQIETDYSVLRTK